MTIQIHFIPYFIHYNPQKDPQFPWKLNAAEQMDKEIWYFKKDVVLCQSISTY